MAERNYHVIGRQILELDVPSIAHAPAVQEAAAQRLRAPVMTELEALFDRLAGPGFIMRLERVEIDLGDLRGADWQDQFESQLVERLTHSLEQTAERARRQAAPESGPAESFEQYMFFLRHGRLPWWNETPPQDWLHRVLHAMEPHQWQALQRLLAGDVHALQRLIHTANDATLAVLLDRHAGLPNTQRLFDLWRPAEQPQTMRHEWRLQFWMAVLNPHTELTAATHARGVAVMRRLLEWRRMFAASEPRVIAPGVRASHATPDLPLPWRAWLAEARCDSETPLTDTAKAAMSQDNAPHPHPAIQQARNAETLPPHVAPPLAGTMGVDSNRSGEPPVQEQTDSMPPVSVAMSQDTARHPLPAVQQARTAETTPTHVAPPLAGTMGVDLDRSGESPTQERTETTPPVSPAQSYAQREACAEHKVGTSLHGGEAIYLNGAGCIILHPFLEELFRSNDLLAVSAFCNAAARERAVRLLAYLTFGDELTPEYELLLPKLLCGMAWEEPLAPIELTDAERTACDQLLRAVLTHWRALKSNSIDWMREQFFLRAAKLERLESHWRLTVERRAQDVLLDGLPWGLGVVGLPWMQGRVYVHWMK